MLIQESYHDVTTKADGAGVMRTLRPLAYQSLATKRLQEFMSSTLLFRGIQKPALQALPFSPRSTKAFAHTNPNQWKRKLTLGQ